MIIHDRIPGVSLLLAGVVGVAGAEDVQVVAAAEALAGSLDDDDVDAVVGGAAMGAVAEKPETAGRALVFVGLAEGIAIYGLIVAIMILGYLK